jgi:hypothetical protein
MASHIVLEESGEKYERPEFHGFASAGFNGAMASL